MICCATAPESCGAVHQRRRTRHHEFGQCDGSRRGLANQAGGNREGVLDHVMAMMLSLSKHLMLADHAMRAGGSYDRRELMATT